MRIFTLCCLSLLCFHFLTRGCSGIDPADFRRKLGASFHWENCDVLRRHSHMGQRRFLSSSILSSHALANPNYSTPGKVLVKKCAEVDPWLFYVEIVVAH